MARKPASKPAAKPAAKRPAKSRAKPAAKPPAKSSAKSPAKTAAKQPAHKESFRQKLSDVFEDMWDTIGKHHMGISGRAFGGDHPPTDMKKTARTLTLDFDVPGMNESDIHIAVANGMLTISGEKQADRETKGEGYVFRERSYGSFSRAFSLPPEAQEDGVTAHLEKGVLTVKVPLKAKAPAPDAKRIPIQKK
jgi:HSP20 family protein